MTSNPTGPDGRAEGDETPTTEPAPGGAAPLDGGGAAGTDEGDGSEPDGAWFQSTQPPSDGRSEGPDGERRVDPVMYVLGAIAIGVVVLGGLALMT